MRTFFFLTTLCSLLCSCNVENGSLFERTFGFAMPEGITVLDEHRIINDDGLLSTYYLKFQSESEDAFLSLVSLLSATQSNSPRTTPIAPANGMHWWIDSAHSPSEVQHAERYLSESPTKYVGIVKFQQVGYLWMNGDSVRH